jgi:hypothetical protein
VPRGNSAKFFVDADGLGCNHSGLKNGTGSEHLDANPVKNMRCEVPVPLFQLTDKGWETFLQTGDKHLRPLYNGRMYGRKAGREIPVPAIFRPIASRIAGIFR